MFFLVRVGRGADLGELTPDENEHVCHFLADASCYGFIVRTVEAPFFRRVVAQRRAGMPPPGGGLYARLAGRLRRELGPGTGRVACADEGNARRPRHPLRRPRRRAHALRLPALRLGNVRDDDIVDVYREHPLLRQIRAADFGGRCGRCEYRELCGGSRARAYAFSGDALGEDPACGFEPAA